MINQWLDTDKSILIYPNPVLRAKAEHITDLSKIDKVIEIMFETMYKHHGWGLAATQVGLLAQIFVINTDLDKSPKKEHVFINPEITHRGDRVWTEVEGCLSIPGVFADVERPRQISLTYLLPNGKIKKITYEGMTGRVCSHEENHLQGVLFIDLLGDAEKERIKPEMEKFNAD